MGNRLTGLLVLTGLVLAGLAAAELHYGTVPERPIEVAAPAPETSAALSTPNVNLPPLASFSETVSRPLFTASRRPYEPPPEAEAQAQGSETNDTAAMVQLDGMALSAVVMRGDDRVVLLRDPQSGELAHVRQGETLAGWSVDEIRADSVVLSQAGETRVVPLRRFEPRPPAAGGAAADPREDARRVEQRLQPRRPEGNARAQR